MNRRIFLYMHQLLINLETEIDLIVLFSTNIVEFVFSDILFLIYFVLFMIFIYELLGFLRIVHFDFFLVAFVPFLIFFSLLKVILNNIVALFVLFSKLL